MSAKGTTHVTGYNSYTWILEVAGLLVRHGGEAMATECRPSFALGREWAEAAARRAQWPWLGPLQPTTGTPQTAQRQHKPGTEPSSTLSARRRGVAPKAPAARQRNLPAWGPGAAGAPRTGAIGALVPLPGGLLAGRPPPRAWQPARALREPPHGTAGRGAGSPVGTRPRRALRHLTAQHGLAGAALRSGREPAARRSRRAGRRHALRAAQSPGAARRRRAAGGAARRRRGRRAQSSGAGSCVGRMPKRFLSVTRSRLNLSSGEKRAGWALLVGVPSGATFCGVAWAGGFAVVGGGGLGAWLDTARGRRGRFWGCG